MSRCGCSSQCSCIVTGLGGILVTGNGSPANPYTVFPVGNDPAWTAAVGTALADLVGPGLLYSGGLLQVKLSQDDGNTLSFGSDSGLYDSGGSGPTPDTGGATVAGLPATGIAGGYGSGGAGTLIAPEGMRIAFEQGVALGLDIMTMRSRSLADGSLVVAPSTDLTQYVPGRTNEAYLTNIADSPLPRFKTLYVNAGNQAESYTGWFGWYSTDEYGFATVSEAFEVAGRRSVLMVMPGDARAWTNTLSEILLYGLTKSVIIYQTDDATTDGLDVLSPYINAGIAACVHIPDDAAAAVLTPAVLTGAGVKWVTCSVYLDRVSDANITAYKDAGLNVLLLTQSFHYQTDKATALGVRGVLAADPVYASKVPARYRMPGAGGSRNGMRYFWYGQLSSGTYLSRRFSGENMNQAMRGYYQPWSSTDSSFCLPKGTGNYTYGVLLGNVAPLPNAQLYTFKVNMRFQTLPTDKTRFVGAAFSCPDDMPWGGDGAGITGMVNRGYSFGLRANGKLAAWKSGPNPVTYSEVTTGLTPAANTTYAATVVVTATNVTITINGKTLTIADTEYRGNYAHLIKHEGNSPFVASYTSWGVS